MGKRYKNFIKYQALKQLVIIKTILIENFRK